MRGRCVHGGDPDPPLNPTSARTQCASQRSQLTLLALLLALLPGGRRREPAPVRALPGRRRCCVENGDGRARGRRSTSCAALGVDMIKVQLNWADGGARRPAQAERASTAATRRTTRAGRASTRVLADAQRTRLQGDVRARAARARLGHRGTRGDRAGVNRPERARVRALRRGRRAGASPASTSGRSGTSRTTRATSIPQSTNGACRWRRTSTARWSAPGCAGLDARRRTAATRSSSASCCRSASRRTGPEAQPEADPLPARVLQPRASALTGVDGFAYHPYTRAGRALAASSPRSDDATIRSYGRITRALDSARASGRIARQEAADLEHRVRLPDEPARPVTAPDRRACRDFWSRLRAVVLLSEPPRQEPSRSTR